MTGIKNPKATFVFNPKLIANIADCQSCPFVRVGNGGGQNQIRFFIEEVPVPSKIEQD
jgi:hypothetical protein